MSKKGESSTKPQPLLTFPYIFMGLAGLMVLIFPVQFYALAPDTPPSLIAGLRIQASTFLGIAVLNWISRNAEPSKALTAIVYGNIVGFGLSSLLGFLSLFSGVPLFMVVFPIINLLFVVAFYWTGRKSG